MPHKTDINKLASQKWTSSGLSNEQARRLKLRGLAGDETKKLSVSFMPAGSLLIPYFDADGEPTKFFRIRYLEDLPGFKGQAKKPQRYAQPPGSLNEVYLPPLLKGRTWKQVLSDIETTLYITEGELKAACATARGLPTIGLGGVDVWRSQRRKMPLLPQLEDVVWKGRKVVIVFDSDAATNTDVVRAQRQLSKTLTERGAAPTVAALPPTPDGKKQGLDDFLVANGVDALKDIVDGAASTEEAQALWAMNEEVVFIRDPGLVVERKTGARMATQVFTGSVYANRTHVDYSGEKPKRVKTAQRWIEWPERFEASRLTYSPGKEQLVDGMWNLWQGWGVEPKKGDVSPWLRLLDFIFKDEVAARQWFERWCAYPLQNPGTKLFTSAAIWGIMHGTGKTLIGYTLRDIYGKNGLEIKNHHLTGGFNEWAANKQFIIGDEVTGSDKRIDADRLKGLITQEEMIINAKFLPAYRIDDCVNYYFTSNNPDAFFLDDSDRRFFIHEVIGSPADPKLYEQYDKWRKNGGPAHLFDYLLHLPLGDFNPKGHAMVTRAKEDMMRGSKSELGLWVRDLLEDPLPGLRPLGEIVAKKAELVTASQLLRCYDPERTTRVTSVGLGRELRRAGLRQLPLVRTASGVQRLYAVRDRGRWERAKLVEAAKHWEDVFGGGKKF